MVEAKVVGTKWILTLTLQEFLDVHIRIRLIRPSHSPHDTPILLVQKKNGSLWLCVDFYDLNKITKKDRYLFSTMLITLCTSPKLVSEKQHSEPIMGHLSRWLCLSLTNAPAAFQCFINDIFSNMLDMSVLAYLDDILVSLDNLDDHQKNVKEVLQWLQKHSLYAHGDKYELHKTKMEFLGCIISDNSLWMSPDKVKTVLEWSEPW